MNDPKPVTETQLKMMKPMIRAFTGLNVWIDKLSGGRMMNRLGGGDVCLVKMTGAKSGKVLRDMSPLPQMPFIGLLVLLAGCPAPIEVIDTSGVETTMRKLAATMAAYDFENTKALFEEDATWIEMGTKPIGLDSLSQRALPLQILGVKSSWEFTNIRIKNEGPIAWATWCWCPAKFSVATGEAARIIRDIFETSDLDQREWQMDMMVSAVLRKHGEDWLFVQGHVSQRAPQPN